MELNREFLNKYDNLMAEDTEKALEFVLNALNNTNNSDFYAYAADCYMTLGEFDKAIDMIDNGLKNECRNKSFALSLKGETLFYMNEYIKSKEVFEMLYKDNPTSFFVIAYLMYIYINLKEYDKAIRIGEKALSTKDLNNNDSAYISITIGWIKLKYLNDADNAVIYFNDALKLDDKSGRGYIGLGEYYFKKCDYKNALINFDKAIDLDEGTISVYFNIAMCYKHLKMYEEAYEYLKIVCDAESDNSKYIYEKNEIKKLINNI